MKDIIAGIVGFFVMTIMFLAGVAVVGIFFKELFS